MCPGLFSCISQIIVIQWVNTNTLFFVQYYCSAISKQQSEYFEGDTMVLVSDDDHKYLRHLIHKYIERSD